MRVLAVVAGVVLLPFHSAFANEQALETITVIAEEEESGTGDVQLEEHTGTHHRLYKRDLERQDVNLGEIIGRETGVQFRQVGGLGTLTTVTLRGASSQQTGVYLDGILLNTAGNSTVDLSLFDLLSIDAVDIYNGASPVQFASAGIGGAVNLRTIAATNVKPESRASVTAGSFNTSRFQFSHKSAHEAWDVVAAASREISENDFSFINDNATPLNPLDDTRERRNNAQVHKLSAISRIGRQWHNSARTDVLLQANTRELGIPEWLNKQDNEASYDTDAFELQLTHRLDNIGNWNNATSLFRHQQNNHYLDAKAQIGLGSQNAHSDAETSGVKTYWEHIGNKGTFATTVSIRKETLDYSDTLTANQSYRVTRDSVGANAQYAWFTLNERLLVTPALRFQSVDDRYSGITIRNTNSRRDSKITPQIGLRFTASESVTIKSNLGQFIREPAFSELFGSRGLVIGNSRLRPEEGMNADLGFIFKPSQQYTFQATAYASWRDELIALAFDAQGIGRSINSGKANIVGLELKNEWQLNKAFNAQVNATFQQSRNYDANPALNNKEIPGQASTVANAKLRYTKNTMSTWLEANHKGRFYFDQANLLPGNSYWLIHLGADWRWRSFQFSAVFNNIANINVEDFNGFPRPGRAVFFSLTYKL